MRTLLGKWIYLPQKSINLIMDLINCKLLFFENLSSKAATIAARIAQQSLEPPLNESSSMVLNRLNKNQKRLSAWLRKKINCYRIYDRDLPEFALRLIFTMVIFWYKSMKHQGRFQNLYQMSAKNLRLAVKVFAIRNGLEILYKNEQDKLDQSNMIVMLYQVQLSRQLMSTLQNLRLTFLIIWTLVCS